MLTHVREIGLDIKNITKRLAMERGAGKLAIYISEPWIDFEFLWVLVYPNLFVVALVAVVILIHLAQRYYYRPLDATTTHSRSCSRQNCRYALRHMTFYMSEQMKQQECIWVHLESLDKPNELSFTFPVATCTWYIISKRKAQFFGCQTMHFNAATLP